MTNDISTKVQLDVNECNKGKIMGIWLSDIHLLHQRTPTTHILNNMSTLFFNKVDMGKLDLVIFGGDIFHRLAENTKDPDFLKIMEWFKKFFGKCVEHNVSVYILEGTSSHDWGQAKHLDIWKPKGSNIYYIDKIEVIKDRNLGLDILFVPDNMAVLPTTEIWNLVVKALAESGLDKVDITALHGAFDYQLPPPARKHTHNQENFESITKYAIYAGHIHIGSTNGKVKVSGSFDRISHGEEHPKGAFIFTIDKDKELLHNEFYENTNALTYVTFKLTPQDTLDEIRAKVERRLREEKMMGARFKLQGGSPDVVNGYIDRLKEQYPYFSFEADNEVDDSIVVDSTLFDKHAYTGVEINKENITTMLVNREVMVIESEEEEDYLKEVLKEYL